MGRTPKGRQIAYALMALGVVATLAGTADASVHFMMVKEVYAGSPDSPNAQFVELQMYSGGQTFTQNSSVVVYNAGGGEITRFTFPSGANQGNGSNQATILVATPEARTYFGFTGVDLEMTAVIPGAGGKVCFTGSNDCVSWGSYTGISMGTGTPFNVGEGIPPGASATRKISGGSSATLLDPGDDTNNSAADFELAGPTPQTNGPTSGTVPSWVGFSAVDYTVPETIGSAVITVNRSPATAAMTVQYSTIDGTAIEGSDYTMASGVLSFVPDESSKTFSVPITSDSTQEYTETVRLTLRNPSLGVLSPPNATLRIQGELSPKKPGAPEGLTATVPASSTGTIDLAWSAPADNGGAAITNYRIYRGSTAGGPYMMLAMIGPSTTFRNTSLPPNTTYYYRVSAVNSEGEGPQSNEASATTPYLPPGPPRNLNVTPGVGQQVVTWDPPASDGGTPVVRYEVQRAPFAGVSFVVIGSVDAPATTFTDTGCSLVAHKVCYYRVRAISAANLGSAYEPPAPRTGSYMVPTKP